MITSRNPQVLAEYTDSWQLLQNVIIKDGAWQYRPADAAISTVSSAPIWGIHGFNAINGASPGSYPTTVLLSLQGEAFAGTGSSTLWRLDTGASVTVNGFSVTTTDPSELFFLNVKNRCLFAGRTFGANSVPGIIERYPNQTSYQWGKNGPVVDLTYDSLQPNVTNANTKTFFQAADATATNNSTTVTSAGSHFDNTGAWTGKTIYINGSEQYTISTVTATNSLTLTTKYTGTGGSNLDFKVTYGELSWQGPGPQYAYAYYNPSTGHITNVGTVMSVSEQNVSTVRMNVSSIQGTNDSNYTKIVLFRTALAGGSVLLPLKLNPSHGGTAPIDSSLYMINNNYTGGKTYSDGQADSQLGQILGTPADINGTVAPFLNNPPPSDIKFMAAWDGRIWVVSASTPYRLQYSGNSAQIPLGRPEESFPFSNYLDLQGDDGFFTALKVVGPSLLAYTEKFIYYVDNSGPYRLGRISSRGAGVDQWSTDEHPGDSTEQSASAVFVGRDRRLWRQYPAGKIEDIGWQIQDKLDGVNLNKTRPIICRVFQIGKTWMLALGISRSAGAPSGPTSVLAAGTATFTNGSTEVDWLSGDHFSTGSWVGYTLLVNGSLPETISIVDSTTMLHTVGTFPGSTGTYTFQVNAPAPATGAAYDWLFYDFDEQVWLDLGYAAGLNPNAVGLTPMWNGVWTGVYYYGNQSGSGVLALAFGTQIYFPMASALSVPITSAASPAEMRTQHLDFGDRLSKKGLQEVTLYVSDDTQTIGSSSWAVSVQFDESGTFFPLQRISVEGTPRDPGGQIIRWNLSTQYPVNQFHSMQLKINMAGQGVSPVTRLYKVSIAYNIDSTGMAGANN